MRAIHAFLFRRLRLTAACAAALLALAAGTQAANVCVAPGGTTPTPPYTDWTIAATNIQVAVDYASTNYPAYDTVVVSNGTYSVTSHILVTNAITIRSFEGGFGGATSTIVQATGTADPRRVFKLEHAGAVLHGLTIRNGYIAAGSQHGAGIHMTGGWVSDCIITNNSTSIHNVGGEGAGVYMIGGVVSNCVVVKNSAGGNTSSGTGVRMTGGALVTHSLIANNTLYAGFDSGAGVCMNADCILRNCLVRNNLAGVHEATSGGGGVSGGHVESCTVVANEAARGANGGGTLNSTVTNSVVTGNSGRESSVANWSGGSFSYSCTTPLPAGTGNTSLDPHFADAGAGNYRLLPASPCRDTGIFQAWWMTGAPDLDGHPRVYNGTDMGAYELTPGALTADFVADARLGIEPLTAILTAAVIGTNMTSLYYKWDLDNNGSFDVEGSDKAVITNAFNAGSHSINLEVSNGAGETATRLRSGYIVATKPTIHVAAGNAGAAAPYMDWATAAATIGAALNVASDGTTVLVSNGAYNITAQIEINNAVTLRGLHGADATTVKQTSTGLRVVRMQHSGAVLDGITVCGARGDAVSGLGIYMSGGLVRNCVISNNATTQHGTMYGVGIYMDGGVVSNCVVSKNGTSHNNSSGPAIYMLNGARVTHSVISNNYNNSGYAAGNGIAIVQDAGSRVRNCLVSKNSTSSTLGPAVLRGVVESCTVADNVGHGTHNCTVIHSILYSNSGNNYGGTGSISNSCATPLPAGGGNIATDPLFVDAAGGDYRLRHEPVLSLCIDAGVPPPSKGAPYVGDLAWLNDSTDLAGEPRYRNDAVDIGAYETFVPPRGTVILLR